MPVSQNVRWVFTLNNYTDVDITHLATLVPSVASYLVYGREVAPTTLTPHLQGYVHFLKRKSLSQAKLALGNPAIHLEVSRGTADQAADYCKKEGQFQEFGALLVGGKRNDWHDLRDWLDTLRHPPTDSEMIDKVPHLWARNRPALLKMIQIRCPPHPLVAGDPRPWQARLASLLDEPPDDRKIVFVVDPQGNKGKTWFQKFYLQKRPNDVQLLLMGKRDDMAYSIDPNKSVFMINVPRGSIEFLQYSVLEMLKDRIVHSPKYESMTKFLARQCHVVVFTNEFPSMTHMTSDRPMFFSFDGTPVTVPNSNFATFNEPLAYTLNS